MCVCLDPYDYRYAVDDGYIMYCCTYDIGRNLHVTCRHGLWLLPIYYFTMYGRNVHTYVGKEFKLIMIVFDLTMKTFPVPVVGKKSGQSCQVTTGTTGTCM